MSELIFLVEEAPDGGFTARALGQSIFTEADTLAELPEMQSAVILRKERAQKLFVSTMFAKKSSPYEASPRSIGE